jgi:nuclease-like protein
MGAVVHGRPGRSILEHSGLTAAERSSARRGAFFEKQVARMLHRWLARRSDEVHVFHDLVGLNNVSGAGLKPLSLGGSNIDHLVLTGDGWLMIDAKGCGAGSLQVHDGKGVLMRDDGTSTPQPWMDDRTAYSRAGVPYRLTEGKGGAAVWVLPRVTTYDHPSFQRARFLSRGGHFYILHDAELADGELDAALPASGKPAEPRDVERLSVHLSAPDVSYHLGPDSDPDHGVDGE